MAIITNYGHLFGTFATERGFFYHIHENPTLGNKLIKSIDKSLQDSMEDIFHSGNIYKIHHIISSIAINEIGDSAAAKASIEIMKKIHLEKNKESVRKIVWALKSARQIAYNRLHSLMRIGITFQPESYPKVLHEIREDMNIGPLDQEEQSSIQIALSALDEYHATSIFTSNESVSLVLKHLQEFRLWWSNQNISIKNILKTTLSLHKKPEDWPVESKQDYTHTLRMQLPFKDWIPLVRTIRPDNNFWRQQNGNFLVTPHPNKNYITLDLYEINDKNITSQALYKIAKELSERAPESWSEALDRKRKIMQWKSTARFGLMVFQRCIRIGLHTYLAPIAAEQNHAGYAMIFDNKERGLDQLRKFIAKTQNKVRKQELEGIVFFINSLELSTKQILLLFLGTILIKSDTTNETVQELDGLLCLFEPSKQRWIALEHKSGAGSGVNQLSKLGNHLNTQISEPKNIKVDSGSKACIIEFDTT